MIRKDKPGPKARYGMVIDVDRCSGCGACMVACAVENNVAPVPPQGEEPKGITPIRVYRVNGGGQAVFLPVMCQQCDRETPCVAVCPQQAVEFDPATGVVGQIPERCLGCRYCMAACPYHARYFNWWDAHWPDGMEKTLNPAVSPRMRGVVEKCNFCASRWHAAREKAAAEGADGPVEYTPACVEACPAQAIVFGDLNNKDSAVSKAARSGAAFQLLDKLGTGPKVYYQSRRKWVRETGREGFGGQIHG